MPFLLVEASLSPKRLELDHLTIAVEHGSLPTLPHKTSGPSDIPIAIVSTGARSAERIDLLSTRPFGLGRDDGKSSSFAICDSPAEDGADRADKRVIPPWRPRPSRSAPTGPSAVHRISSTRPASIAPSPCPAPRPSRRWRAP